MESNPSSALGRGFIAESVINDPLFTYLSLTSKQEIFKDGRMKQVFLKLWLKNYLSSD